MRKLILSAILIFGIATTTIFANDGGDKDKTKKKEKKAKLHKRCTVSDKKSCHS